MTDAARPELLGLLRACKDAPDDDTPRLILADWVEDHSRGPADLGRAVALRAGVAAARLEDVDDRQRMEWRATEQLNEFQKEWLHALLSCCDNVDSELRRGLFDVTTFDTTFLTRAGTALAESEEWQWVDHLRLTGYYHARPAEALLASCLLPSLNGLDLSRSLCFPQDVRDLAESAQCAGLVALSLAAARGALRTLTESPHLARLRSLSLRSSTPDAADVTALAESHALPALREIDLSWNNLRDRGVALLAASPRFADLESLDLGSNGIGNAGARALASSGLRRLRRLGLSGNVIGEKGALALAESPALEHLERLDFHGNKAGRRGNAALRERFGGRVRI